MLAAFGSWACVEQVSPDGSGDDEATGGDSDTQPGDDDDAPADSESTAADGGDTGETWPDCVPPQIEQFEVGIGGNGIGFAHQPDDWPTGHYSATCVVAEVDIVEEEVQGNTRWTTTVSLVDCVDEEGQPFVMHPEANLDFEFYTGEAEFTTAVAAGLIVAVDYTTDRGTRIAGYPNAHAWYTLRDAATGDLLLGYFGDPGEDIAPDVDGSPGDEWLAPLSASESLADPVCPAQDPCDGEHAEPRPQIEFLLDGEVHTVLAGMVADIGNHRVHVADYPDVCPGEGEYPDPGRLRAVLTRVR